MPLRLCSRQQPRQQIFYFASQAIFFFPLGSKRQSWKGCFLALGNWEGDILVGLSLTTSLPAALLLGPKASCSDHGSTHTSVSNCTPQFTGTARLSFALTSLQIQMSTISPNHREGLANPVSHTMAVATPAKTKAAAKAANNANPKTKTQMHRRSRTGKFSLPIPICSSIQFESVYVEAPQHSM